MLWWRWTKPRQGEGKSVVLRKGIQEGLQDEGILEQRLEGGKEETCRKEWYRPRGWKCKGPEAEVCWLFPGISTGEVCWEQSEARKQQGCSRQGGNSPATCDVSRLEVCVSLSEMRGTEQEPATRWAVFHKTHSSCCATNHRRESGGGKGLKRRWRGLWWSEWREVVEFSVWLSVRWTWNMYNKKERKANKLSRAFNPSHWTNGAEMGKAEKGTG